MSPFSFPLSPENGTILLPAVRILRCDSREISTYKRHLNDEQMEENKRLFGVVAESLRSDLWQIAERHEVIRHELRGQREELREEFKETKALVRMSFTQLDQQIHALESDVSVLKSRVDRLESSRT